MDPTEESFRMLLTEEGQVNAVFACFGSAAQHAQAFEEELRRFLTNFNKLFKTHFELNELEDPKKTKKTMGGLLKQLRKRVTVKDQHVNRKFDQALVKRNFLIHHFFLKRGAKLKTVEGRMGLLQELVHIEQDLELARAWVGGMRIAMQRALSGKRGTHTDGGDALFTIEINLPDPSSQK
jgi:hypothetical protein